MTSPPPPDAPLAPAVGSKIRFDLDGTPCEGTVVSRVDDHCYVVEIGDSGDTITVFHAQIIAVLS